MPSESPTTKQLADIGDRIRDIRTPGYIDGWNDALDAAAKACDENGWSWNKGQASNVVLGLKKEKQ